MLGLAIIFFAYSFLGWVFEVVRAAVEQRQFVNKGFLYSPLCPRYGIAMVLIMVLLKPWKGNYLVLFVGCMLIGSAVEYISALMLEKITCGKWWDYSNMPFQYRGRISLLMAFVWGVLGCVSFTLNSMAMAHFAGKELLVWQIVVGILVVAWLLFDCFAAFMTVLSIQDNFRIIIKVAARIRKTTRKLADWIFENTKIRMKQKEIRDESARMRNIYRKERENRRMKWLKQRMILAAPDLAPDEETLERINRKQKSKKKKLFRRIMLNRVLFTAIALIVQIVWLGILLTSFASSSSEITLAMTVLSFVMSVFILTKNDNSAYKISWIILIMSFPLFGGILYLFFGNKNPSRKMRQQIEKVHEEKSKILHQDLDISKELASKDPGVAGRSLYLYNHSDCPIWTNTKTTYFPLGDDMFEDVLEELKKAEHFIFLEFFIVEDGIFWGSILEILEEKAKAGVDVRVMYDDIGCLTLLPKNYVKRLESAGISCIAFNPFKPILSLAMNNRDHRKILVIDGHTAYTGGVNLADEYINMADRFGHWKDTAMKFKGDAVANFTVMFLEMWNAFRKTDDDFSAFFPHVYHKEEFEGEGYVQPFGDTPLDNEPTAENLYIDILNRATKYVYIYTPYLIISDTMSHALCMAAGRGVDVRILTPGIPDKKVVYRLTRNNYKELMKAGVEIYEYTPGFLHAKSYVSDDTEAVIGTINMDYRSLYLHFECGAYLHGTDTVLDMKTDFLETMKKSRKMELRYMKQGLIHRFIDALLSIFSPLV